MPIKPIMPIMEFSLASTPQGNPKIDEEKLKKACIDFESLFINRMLESMRKTVPESEFLGKGPEKEVFQSLFDEELSRSLARGGGMGLGNMMYEQMMKRFKTPE